MEALEVNHLYIGNWGNKIRHNNLSSIFLLPVKFTFDNLFSFYRNETVSNPEPIPARSNDYVGQCDDSNKLIVGAVHSKPIQINNDLKNSQGINYNLPVKL